MIGGGGYQEAISMGRAQIYETGTRNFLTSKLVTGIILGISRAIGEKPPTLTGGRTTRCRE